MRRLVLVAILLWALPAGAADDDLFERANADYAARNYTAAILKYEQLVSSGVVHEDLFYNLGNAYFRAAQAGQKDHLGRAILAYERALALAPDFEDARFNLEVARELVGARYGQDKVKDASLDPVWVRVATWLPLTTLSWLFFGVDVLFFALLIGIRFLASGFLRTGLVVATIFTGLAGLALGALLALQVYYVETVKVGVVVSDEIVMREGPDVARREGPKLHAGHRARLLREDHGWVRIRLANQVEGWVPRQSVEEIGAAL
jgi:tetratricopeptide (TPR) repeat protein